MLLILHFCTATYLSSGQETADMTNWKITKLVTCLCCLNLTTWLDFTFSIHVILFTNPMIFQDWQILGPLHHMVKFKKFPFSYFIIFILYWSCLFLCDMSVGLLGCSHRMKLLTVATFSTKWTTYIQTVKNARLIYSTNSAPPTVCVVPDCFWAEN